MSSGLDKAITWRDAIEIGLLFGGEYAMLALIENAPKSLQAATMVCAIATLVAMRAEDKIRGFHPRLFRNVLILLGVVYLGFVAYAINYVIDQQVTRNGLKTIYTSATPLIDRHISLGKPAQGQPANALDQAEVDQFAEDYFKWENSSAQWIKDHLGDAAHDHFLDRSNTTTFIQWGDVYDPKYDHIRNLLSGQRRNLIAIMESKVYE
jgi:hypothetical protein